MTGWELMEEDDRRREINDLLDQHPVHHGDLQRFSERRSARTASVLVAAGVILLALAWFFWG